MSRKQNYGLEIAIVSLLIPVLCQLANPVNARHQAPESNDSVLETALGIDKWHAPPVENVAGIPELNQKVANFAVAHLGKQVGNGECWTLAKEALSAAGAQQPEDYVFGRELGRSEPWLPGDIIQFTACHFQEIQPHKYTTFNLGTPNHTAIVHSLSNGLVVVLQQNVNDDRRVQTQTLNFANMVSGSFKLYRPLAAAPNNMGQQETFLPHHHKHSAQKNNDLLTNQNRQDKLEKADKTNKQDKFAKHDNSRHLLSAGDEVSPGLLYEERKELLQKIRRLQANGVNVYFYMQRFMDIDMRANSSRVNGHDPVELDNMGIAESINTLNQLLSIREAKLTQPP